MTPKFPEPSPGSEPPVAGATSDSNSSVRPIPAPESSGAPISPRGPKRCPTCGTSYSGELCPKCIAGFANVPPGETAPPVTPYDETVQLAHKGERRAPKTEPAIPEEAAGSPATARFGKFIRTKRLGAGGMGEVWKAWDTVLGRWVALKFLKGGDDDEIARFRREAQTAGRLHHPNIAAIFEVDEDQGRHYIAMQFVDGQTLHTFPRDDRRQLVKLIACAAQALHYAHDQGVIHRDLKPENLMVVSRTKAEGKAVDHHVYVMDFGLARLAEGASKLSVSGFVVGTPAYMSPEQARGEKVDARSDVYSLGVTLYELLTGKRPFESDNVYETLRRVQEVEPAPPRKIDPKIPSDLETIALKCMAKEPGGRYATAQALADDLFAFNAGEPILARRESLTRLLARRVKRHPVAFAAAILLALGLAVSGTIGVTGTRARQAARLTKKLDALLRNREWVAARQVASELEALSPADTASVEAGFRASLSEAFHRDLAAGDLTQAKAALEPLEVLDPAEAAKLRTELRLRESSWPAVFSLDAPFAGAAALFDQPVRVEAVRVTRADGAPVVLTKKPSGSGVELRAEFEGGWKGASLIGLVLNATRSNATKTGGYHFLLTTGLPGPNPLPSFDEMRQGTCRLRILRNDAVVLDQPLPGPELFASGDATLRLFAKREGERLIFQVNDRKPVEGRDPFAVGIGPRGVFAVHWPLVAGLRHLRANQREMPRVPNGLEQADDLFVEAKYEEALQAYRSASLAAALPAVRDEARYKEGLCELACNREEEALRVFEEVAARFLQADKDRKLDWIFMADCQLLMHYFKQKDGIEKAGEVLDRLSAYGYPFDKVALLMPQDVQSAILYNNETGSAGQNLHRRPEEHLARAEFTLRASQLVEPSGKVPEYRVHGVLRAQMLVGRNGDALRTAERMFKDYRYGGDWLDDYCWILRLQGQAKDALAAIDRGVKNSPVHLVERSRVKAALGDWDGALQDVEEFVAKPTDYHYFSAACLLRGFLLERRGAPAEQVREAWRQGLIKNWKPTASDKGLDGSQARSPYGMPMLNHWIMSSLTGEMTDADAEQLLAGLLAFAGKDNPVFNKLMRPSVLRVTWRTPRGLDLARELAFRTVPFAEALRYPLFLGWIAFLHELCFPPEPLSSDQDEVLWRFANEVYTAYRNGTITERFFLPFGVIAQGNPNSPGMGWKEIAKLLEPLPRLRGPLGYVFGQRYVKKGDPANALLFYKSALYDAGREGGDPLLRRLTQPELDRLSK